MGALADLWKSERGLVALLLIVAVTVLAALGRMAAADWQSYTLYIFGGYTVAKTVTSAVETHTSGKMAIAGVDTTTTTAKTAIAGVDTTTTTATTDNAIVEKK